MAEWHDLESAREQWGDAEHISDELLAELLEVALNDVMSYARKVHRDAYEAATEEEPFDVPTELRMAQRRQAENIWNAAVISNPAGGTGGGDFIIQPHPLDWHIKQLIRPKRAVPRVR